MGVALFFFVGGVREKSGHCSDLQCLVVVEILLENLEAVDVNIDGGLVVYC